MGKLLRGRPRSFYAEFDRKPGDTSLTHYCPGCGHGNIHKYIAEAIDDMGIADRVVFVNPVGCSVFAYYYIDVGHIQAPHGRAPAVATGVKRARPDSIVICYQGDGDLGAIGGNEIVQAANRGEDMTVIFVNNALYGMTGGQMAPTSLLGQITTTTPRGRESFSEGYPMRVCELLSGLEAPAYLERVALGDVKHNLGTRKAIRRGIKNQVEKKGFSLVEVLSPCPTGWKVEPAKANTFVLETMTKTFPLGIRREPPPADSAPTRKQTGLRTDVKADAIAEALGLVGADGRGDLGDWSIDRVEARFRNPRIKVAGFGGQGVLFLGALIAEAGMLAGCGVSWLPSYGPEMRGGTAHCHVTLSDGKVDSPLVTQASVLFAFNRPSLERFVSEVEKGGLVIYDASLIPEPPSMPDVEVIAVPASDIADRIGVTRMANVVALGAYLKRTNVIPVASVESTLRRNLLKQEVIDLNMKALQEGMNFRP